MLYIAIAVCVAAVYVLWKYTWHYRMMFTKRLILFEPFIWFKVKSPNGRSEYRPGFLFMPSYKLQRFGKPRAHLGNCRVVREAFFRLDCYRWSGSASVVVKDLDNGGKRTFDDLPVCKYCFFYVYPNY
ncbi:MAG: hypothetical protein RMM53_05550, partial [Bacteroidia bacterium]|nr:hypothetical protein [Bacteroidia bacterium]MDW8333659.1 hypothetical protein [Bacteroidia bacterium]